MRGMLLRLCFLRLTVGTAVGKACRLALSSMEHAMGQQHMVITMSAASALAACL